MKKIKSIPALGVAFALLFGGAVASADADYTTGTPWLDPELPGNVTEETSVNIKDNFALAVNYDSYLTGEIPEGRPYGGTLSNVVINVSNEMNEMLQTIDPSSGHDAELCVNYYNLLLDWDTRNELGMSPILPTIETIKAMDSIDAVSAYFTDTDPAEIPFLPINVSVDSDPNDATAVALKIGSARLILGDSDYYLTESNIGTRTKAATTKLITNLLIKAGFSEEEATDIRDADYAFESKVAVTAYSVEVQNSPEFVSLSNNPMSVKEMSELCGNYPIMGILGNLGLEADKCIVVNPEQLKAFSELYSEENLEGIKAYLIVNTLKSAASRLDRECYEWTVECSNSINGTQGMIKDEMMATSYTANKLVWPISRIYCDTYVTEEDKTTVREMIDQIISEYYGVIEDASFITEETRAYAIKKLENLAVRCLYPDDWTPYDYSAVEIGSPENGGTLFDAERSVSRFLLNKQAARLNQPVDRSRWFDEATPSVINCFYNPADNSINILGAFARGDIFNADMSVEQRYAILGCVIGHEISHAFDSSGAQYDDIGNTKNWWTVDDLAAFDERNLRISDYFSSIEPWKGQSINGSTLTGEACADMGGMTAVLRYAKSIENFDYDAFFRAYAKVWFNVESPAFTQYRIATDTHPLSYLRINTVVQQFDEFNETYGIAEGDGMYMSEEGRIKIW